MTRRTVERHFSLQGSVLRTISRGANSGFPKKAIELCCVRSQTCDDAFQVMEPGRGRTMDGELIKMKGPKSVITLTNDTQPLFYEVYEVESSDL